MRDELVAVHPVSVGDLDDVRGVIAVHDQRRILVRLQQVLGEGGVEVGDVLLGVGVAEWAHVTPAGLVFPHDLLHLVRYGAPTSLATCKR